MNTQTIVITGAASGLGRALVHELRHQNHRLLLLDVDSNGLQQVCKECESHPAMLSLYTVNLASPAEIDAWWNEVQQQHEIDWLINCAGMSITSDGLAVTTAQWQQIVQVNLLGPIQLATLIGQQMRQRKQGRIINIASMFAQTPSPSAIGYGTTKHALLGFSRTLSIELASDNIRVHTVCPGFIQTPFFENATYHGVNKEQLLPDTSQMTTANTAAKRILHGVRRDQSLIIFPFYVRIIWWLEWFLPGIMTAFWQQRWQDFQAKRDKLPNHK